MKTTIYHFKKLILGTLFFGLFSVVNASNIDANYERNNGNYSPPPPPTLCDSLIANFTRIIHGDTVDFFGTSGSTTASSWFWRFGDGNTSSVQNPTHIYATSGTYSVTLIVGYSFPGGCCHDSITKRVKIAGPCDYIPYFVAQRHSYDTINFLDSSTNVPSGAKYFWSFGDGSTSTLQNPTHVYARPGNYRVCMYISIVDSLCNTICVKHYCKTICIVGSPCAGTSLRANVNVIGNRIYGNATITGYRNYHVKWYNGTTYLGRGTNISRTLTPGTHYICAIATKIAFNPITRLRDTCTDTICNWVTIPTVTNPCDTSIVAMLSDSIYRTTVYLYGSHNYTGTGVHYEYWLNGRRVQQGSNPNYIANLTPGTHRICFQVWWGVYDSILNRTDSCFAQVCKTFVINTLPRNPCAGNSISATGYRLGGRIIGTASVTGYSASMVRWYNGTTYLGFGTTLNTTLSTGSHTICAIATQLVYDSIRLRYDTCSDTACFTVIMPFASVSIVSARISSIKLFPNPVRNNITVSFTSNFSSNTRIIVKDMTGKTVLEDKMELIENSKINKILDVSELQRANYYIIIQDNDNKNLLEKPLRFVKQ